jgi:HK97 family phage major capsid protein
MTAPAAPAPADDVQSGQPLTLEQILGALQDILDQAEGRSLTDDEVARYESLEAQMAVTRKSEEIRKRNAAYRDAAPGQILHVAVQKQDNGLERAFNAYMRTGQINQDIAQLRAQGEGVGSQGGYMVPEGFRNKLVERMKAFGGVANEAEQVTTETGQDLPWPTVDDTANTGEIVAEGNTFSSGADLVFGEAALGAYKYMAGGGSSLPLRVSVELLQDAAFDVEGLVSRKLGERLARIQATHIATGTGVSQPLGILTGLTPVGNAANTGLTYNDMLTYMHSVDPAYRESGCRWAFNDKTLSLIQQIKDTNNRPIFRSLDADLSTDAGGGTLLGYPVTIDQSFPDLVANSGTVIWGAFGNISEGYVIRRVRDMQLIVNPWTRASNGQVEYTAWARMDATQQNTFAYSGLTCHA